jgi:hypothetical protein
MVRRFLSFFAVLSVFFALATMAPVAAVAEKKVALVIGNGIYTHLPTLDKPAIDASNMRDGLKALGYDVIYGENLERSTFERRIADFAEAAKNADIALFYFAGYGATFDNKSYMIPIDAQFSAPDAAPKGLVAFESAAAALRHAKSRRIAIIETCHDDAKARELKRLMPLGGDVVRGLLKLDNIDGLTILSTPCPSSDEAGVDDSRSPFTRALLRALRDNAAPGMEVK